MKTWWLEWKKTLPKGVRICLSIDPSPTYVEKHFQEALRRILEAKGETTEKTTEKPLSTERPLASTSHDSNASGGQLGMQALLDGSAYGGHALDMDKSITTVCSRMVLQECVIGDLFNLEGEIMR